LSVVPSHTWKVSKCSMVGLASYWCIQCISICIQQWVLSGMSFPTWFGTKLIQSFYLIRELFMSSIAGMTAYASIVRIGKPQKGETVFVSGAAGKKDCVCVWNKLVFRQQSSQQQVLH
jgi:hypothetical protein